jgi:hypothetical protein
MQALALARPGQQTAHEIAPQDQKEDERKGDLLSIAVCVPLSNPLARPEK